MSLLMVQPLANAEKNVVTGTDSKSQSIKASDSFQTLLADKITERLPESAPISAPEAPAETVSDAACQPTQSEKGTETEQVSDSKADKEEETVLAKQDEKGEGQVAAVWDATVLAQIMAAMGGVQPVQAETIAVSDEWDRALTDEKDIPVLSALSGEIDTGLTDEKDVPVLSALADKAAKDGLPLPVMADAKGGTAQNDSKEKTDKTAYTQIQAEVKQKVSESDGRQPVVAKMEGLDQVNAAIDAEKIAATPAATSPSAGEARQAPVLQQSTALPSSSEQAVLMQPMQLMQPTVQTAAPVNTVPVEARIMQPMGTPEWQQAIGQRVLWMVGQEQQSASLTLNPPDLGPVRVVVSVSNQHASANFFSANPDVRQALEGSLPRLREMMEGAGIQLGQAQVGAENSGSFQQEPGTFGQAASRGGDNFEDEGGVLTGVPGVADMAQPVQVVSTGLVDTFV